MITADWTRALYRAWRGWEAPAPLPDGAGDHLAVLRLTPLTYRVLKDHGVDTPGRLAADYKNALARNMVRLHALRGVIDTLDTADIPAVLLKGSAFLVKYADGDLGLRALADVDLAVPPSRLEEAVRLLVTLGYAGLDAAPLDSDHHAIYLGRKAGAVDLHMDLHRALGPLEGHRRLLRELTASAVSVDSWRVPSPEHWLWSIAVHRLNNGFIGDLRELFDFARVAEDANVGNAVALADRYDACIAMVIAAQHTAHWTGSTVASRLAEALAPRLARRALARVFPAHYSSAFRGTSAFRRLVALPVGSSAPLRAAAHNISHTLYLGRHALTRHKGVAERDDIH